VGRQRRFGGVKSNGQHIVEPFTPQSASLTAPLKGSLFLSPSFARKFLGHGTYLQNKKSLFPYGEQGQKINSAVPPCLREKPVTSVRCQHTGCPLTLAMRQSILRLTSVLSALGGPFADPLFAPLSALRHSLWMRCQLYFRVCGLLYDMLFIL